MSGGNVPGGYATWMREDELRAALDAAIKRAEVAEAQLAQVERYGAAQWRRGNRGDEPQEFAEWQREVQPE